MRNYGDTQVCIHNTVGMHVCAFFVVMMVKQTYNFKHSIQKLTEKCHVLRTHKIPEKRQINTSTVIYVYMHDGQTTYDNVHVILTDNS